MQARRVSMFGDYLRHYRSKSGKTPRLICRDLKLDYDTYISYEKNNNIPDETLARRLIKYLKMPEQVLSLVKKSPIS